MRRGLPLRGFCVWLLCTWAVASADARTHGAKVKTASAQSSEAAIASKVSNLVVRWEKITDVC